MNTRIFLPLLALAACSAEPDRPGQVTADQEEALNDAAEMLDANSVDLDALEEDAAEDADANEGAAQ